MMSQNRQNSEKPNEHQLVRVVRDLVETQKQKLATTRL